MLDLPLQSNILRLQMACLGSRVRWRGRGRVRGPAVAVGGRADVRLARPVAAAVGGLRAQPAQHRDLNLSHLHPSEVPLAAAQQKPRQLSPPTPSPEEKAKIL